MYDYDRRKAASASLRLMVESIRDLTDLKSTPKERGSAKKVLNEALSDMPGPDACLDLLRAMKHTNTSVAEMLNIIQSRI